MRVCRLRSQEGQQIADLMIKLPRGAVISGGFSTTAGSRCAMRRSRSGENTARSTASEPSGASALRGHPPTPAACIASTVWRAGSSSCEPIPGRLRLVSRSQRGSLHSGRWSDGGTIRSTRGDRGRNPVGAAAASCARPQRPPFRIDRHSGLRSRRRRTDRRVRRCVLSGDV